MRFILICSNLICIATSVYLPAECTSATVVNDPSINVNNPVGLPINCDNNLLGSSSGWFRFEGSGGTVIANQSAGVNYCGTNAAGFYSGPYPSTVGGSASGTLCYTYTSSICQWSNPLTVQDCNGYYVYYITLPVPLCDLGVCTMVV